MGVCDIELHFPRKTGFLLWEKGCGLCRSEGWLAANFFPYLSKKKFLQLPQLGWAWAFLYFVLRFHESYTNILRFHEGHSSCSFISVYVSKNVKSHFVCWPAFAKEFVMTSPGEFLILSYCYHATMERTASKDWPQAIHIALIKNNLYCFYISLINKKNIFLDSLS